MSLPIFARPRRRSRSITAFDGEVEDENERFMETDYLLASRNVVGKQALLFQSDQLETMMSHFVKTTAVILLGIVLAWQSVTTVSAGMGVGGPKSTCCCSGCDSKHCSTPACCAKPADSRAPVAPASLPVSQNEWLALATTISSCLVPLPVQTDELQARWPASVSVTAIPLFQRDCCYLI
jgi:hypothetical protein